MLNWWLPGCKAVIYKQNTFHPLIRLEFTMYKLKHIMFRYSSFQVTFSTICLYNQVMHLVLQQWYLAAWKHSIAILGVVHMDF